MKTNNKQTWKQKIIKMKTNNCLLFLLFFYFKNCFFSFFCFLNDHLRPQIPMSKTCFYQNTAAWYPLLSHHFSITILLVFNIIWMLSDWEITQRRCKSGRRPWVKPPQTRYSFNDAPRQIQPTNSSRRF